MALALNNLKRVDMPLNKETKPNQKELYKRRQQHIGDEDIFFIFPLFPGFNNYSMEKEFSLNTFEMVESPSQSI